MKLSQRIFFLTLSLLLIVIFIMPLHAQDEPYRDPTLPVEERVEDLLARMTLEEKIGQMTLVEKNSVTPEEVTEYFIGGVLSGGGGYPIPNTAENWSNRVSGFQDGALATRLGIPMIYGVDAVHGHNNVYGATIFPHNIGLGATRNPDLVEQIGRATAIEMIATGIYWTYAPLVGVPQDIRWGRTYEGYGENTDLVTELSTALIRGLQGDGLGEPGSVLATPKHFIGDGGTTWGTSEFGPNNMDRGDTQVDEETLRALYLPPYQAAVDTGAMSIMASFSSWNGTPMHANEYLLNDVLRGELGFQGFVVSDWGAIDLVDTDYYQAVVSAINAGVDMNMVPYDYRLFIDTMLEAVENGDISMERVDAAVRNILRTKFEMGLFEQPYGDDSLLDQVGSAEHRALAQEAVSQSLVLLKNENETLPLASDTQTIFVAGLAADNIGIQSGGWTIEWQGRLGDITPGTTILDAVQATVSPATSVHYNRNANFDDVIDADGNPVTADVGIVVLGELPYAEWAGDNGELTLTPADAQAVERMRAVSDKLVVILISGRPLIINEQLNMADAFVAAWLPGTEGQGVADVLFGLSPFTGRLPYTWLRGIDQLPFDFDNLPTEGCDAPLFPYDYGLTYEDASSPWLDLAVECSGGTVSSTENTNLELIWSDEFEGEAGAPINPDNWTAEIGGWGWGNSEFEYYTDRTENASLDGNGNLAIVARRETLEGSECYYGTCQYTSARLITQDRFEFTYGCVEARIRVPYGQGIWPAFWMLGADIGEVGWPNSGEIDIMENIGREPNIVHGTLHGPGYSGASGIGAPYTIDEPFADDFHVFAVEWTPTEIRWYVDGNLYNTLTTNDIRGNEWVFNHDFFILLNVAVGGQWPGYPDATTVFPQTMLVDYVRVYRLPEQ